jgi:hypothetical protein
MGYVRPPIHRLTITDKRLYNTWYAMVNRCTNPKNTSYARYGGRGITVYEPWLTDTMAFAEWIYANLGPKPERHSLDRIDNDGNYEPGNLRWADGSTQANNQTHPRVAKPHEDLVVELQRRADEWNRTHPKG